MKKLLLALISLFAVSNAFGGFFGCNKGCNTRCAERTEHVGTSCEPKPVCYKMVRKEAPAKKVCETTCHYVCPADTVREECGE